MKICKRKRCGYWRAKKNGTVIDKMCKNLKIKHFIASCKLNKKTKIREYSLGQEFIIEKQGGKIV